MSSKWPDLHSWKLILSDLPDFTAQKNITLLERWDRSWAFLANLDWIKISGSGSVRPFKFPPQTN